MSATKKENLSLEKINTKIPGMVHIIWVGGEFPEEYIKNLVAVYHQATAQGLIVNIWTDNPNSLKRVLISNEIVNIWTDNPESLKDVLASNKIPTRATIRNIEKELYPEAKKQLKDIANKIIPLVESEKVGFANFAAAADLLRYVILYCYGGIYLDADLYPSKALEIPPCPYGFRAGTKASATYNNDILIFSQGHPLIHTVLKNAISQYEFYKKKDLHYRKIINKTKKLFFRKTKMDLKRQYYCYKKNTSNLRLFHTSMCSGPMLLEDAHKTFVKKEELFDTYLVISHQTHYSKYKFGGIVHFGKGTWAEKESENSSFELKRGPI